MKDESLIYSNDLDDSDDDDDDDHVTIDEQNKSSDKFHPTQFYTQGQPKVVDHRDKRSNIQNSIDFRFFHRQKFLGDTSIQNQSH